MSNNWAPSGPPYYDFAGPPFVRLERTVDESHGRPPYNTGGPFLSIKLENSLPKSGLVGYGTYITEPQWGEGSYAGRYKYVGGFMPPQPWFGQFDASNSAEAVFTNVYVPAIATLGDEAWQKTKPKLEQAGLFVAIAEAKDIPHMLHTTSKGFFDIWSLLGGISQRKFMASKEIADHFLNHQFGWVPFLKDVNDLITNVIHYYDTVRRLAEENGKWIRRRSILVNDNTLTKIQSGTDIRIYPGMLFKINPCMFLDVNGHMGSPSWEIWEEKKTYATAVGSFRYYLPQFDTHRDDIMSSLREFQRLYTIFGVRISPVNVYKAIPWTWLIDWMTSLGNNLSYIQDQTLDQMAAKYLYLSHHVSTTRTFKQFMPFNASCGGGRTLEWSQSFDIKQRKEADSPFGFNLSDSDLSARQIAILGALGMTRSRHAR
jgi:hypothetical protein